MNATTSTPAGTLRDDLRLLVHSHIPLIAAETPEEERLEAMVCAIAGELQLPLFVWSMTSGLVRHGTQAGLYGTEDPAKCLANIGLMHDDAVYLFKDGAHMLKDDVLIPLLRDVAAKFKGARRSIILCGATLAIPPEIADQVGQFHLGLPDQAALLAALHETLAEVTMEDGVACPLDPAAQNRVAQALSGMTLEQARGGKTSRPSGPGRRDGPCRRRARATCYSAVSKWRYMDWMPMRPGPAKRFQTSWPPLANRPVDNF